MARLPAASNVSAGIARVLSTSSADAGAEPAAPIRSPIIAAAIVTLPSSSPHGSVAEQDDAVREGARLPLPFRPLDRAVEGHAHPEDDRSHAVSLSDSRPAAYHLPHAPDPAPPRGLSREA